MSSAWGVLMDTSSGPLSTVPRDNKSLCTLCFPVSWVPKTDTKDNTYPSFFCWLYPHCCLQRRLEQVGLLTGPEITFGKFVVAPCLFRWFLCCYLQKWTGISNRMSGRYFTGVRGHSVHVLTTAKCLWGSKNLISLIQLHSKCTWCAATCFQEKQEWSNKDSHTLWSAHLMSG